MAHKKRHFKTLQDLLLGWYQKNKRILPWRGNPDAYAVWVSEIMLQQTRVETVIPYFERWMRSFPTVSALADASEKEVLTAWEGLGYYSRARNLHKAATIVVREHGGEIPRDPDALRKLPGVGRYTAGAIASIAFGVDVPALDGNLKRVYARLFDLVEPVDMPKGERELWDIAEQILPEGMAGEFNQAIMDLGALVCIPGRPRCSSCPLVTLCKARKNGTQELRPVRKPKKEIPHYIHAAGVVMRRYGNQSEAEVLLVKRPSKGLLGGLWEFPNGRVKDDPARELSKALEVGYSIKVRCREALGVIRHAYTHFKVTVHAFVCDLSSEFEHGEFEWVAPNDLDDFPMGKVDRRIADMIQESHLHLSTGGI